MKGEVGRQKKLLFGSALRFEIAAFHEMAMRIEMLVEGYV